jgi:hypothetical protein
MATAFEAAVDQADGDAVEALGVAYRSFARRHPHLYRLMTERELDRPSLTPGVEERAARPIHDALGGDGDLARAAFAFAHGMTILELNNRFPPDADLDAAWKHAYAELFFVLEGQATFTDGVDERLVRAGEVVIVPPDQPHAFVNFGGGRLRQIAVHLNSRFVTDWLDDI